MKIYSPLDDYKLKKLAMTARIYNKQVSVEKIDLNPKISKIFKDCYPQYILSPLLEIGEGKFVLGTNTIMIYLSEQLRNSNKIRKVKIVQQLQRIEREIDSATGILILNERGLSEMNKIQKSKQVLLKYIKQQDDKLHLNTFLIDDQLSIADISCYYNIGIFKKIYQKDFQKYKNVNRWFKHLQSLEKN